MSSRLTRRAGSMARTVGRRPAALAALYVSAILCIPCTRGFRTELYDGLTEGSKCKMEDGSSGVCTRLPSCPLRLREVLEGRRTSTSTGRCSFDRLVEIVCCPVVGTTTTKTYTKIDKVTERTVSTAGSRSQTEEHTTPRQSKADNSGFRPAVQACQDFENTILGEDANEVHTNILNGEPVKNGEFPYVVALGYDVNKPTLEYDCGGTLISFQYVLTAAHCIKNQQLKIPIEVRLGTVDLNDHSEYEERIPIEKVYPHPKYVSNKKPFDIGIVKMNRSINTSSRIKPICLQTYTISNLESMPNIVTAGWGLVDVVGHKSSSLQKTRSLQIIDRIKCSEWYKTVLKQGVDDSMICVLDQINTTARSDSCQGDSGGPLLMLSNVKNTVIGIVSFGQSCGSVVPSIYTSVYFYLQWIEGIVWSELQK